MGQLQDSYTVAGTGNWPVGTYVGHVYQAAQTFIAGETYNINSVEIYLAAASGCTGTLTLGIYATSLEKPTGSALKTGTIDLSTVSTSGAWYEITLADVVALTGSTRYAIVASSTDNSKNVSWLKSDGNYSNGKAGYTIDGGAWSMSDTIDLLFKTYDNAETFAPPVPGVGGSGSEKNPMRIIRRLVAAAANKIWYENI